MLEVELTGQHGRWPPEVAETAFDLRILRRQYTQYVENEDSYSTMVTIKHE